MRLVFFSNARNQHSILCFKLRNESEAKGLDELALFRYESESLLVS